MSPMLPETYLERLRFSGRTSPLAESLSRLHRFHMLSVPFENLDVHLGVPIELSVPAFYDKIVTRRRGGFCYELNGLFAWLLGELGFKVTLLSARVAAGGTLSPEFDHMCLLVELADRWIADVGFGDSSLEPLPLDSGAESADGYSIVNDDGVYTMQRRRGGVVEPQYVFELVPRTLDEFGPRCAWQQTSPESHFTQNTICSRATETGRVSVSGRRLIVTSGGRRDERELASAEEYRGVLLSEFGVELSLVQSERLWCR